jgi:hypothetical protein
LAQNGEAATCCLTDLTVGRDFAQYGQRGDIFWRSSEYELEDQISPPAHHGVFFFFTQVTAYPTLTLCFSQCHMPTLLRRMPHSFQSTIHTQIQVADVLFTCLSHVCGVASGVYKYVSLPIFPQASVLKTYQPLLHSSRNLLLVILNVFPSHHFYKYVSFTGSWFHPDLLTLEKTQQIVDLWHRHHLKPQLGPQTRKIEVRSHTFYLYAVHSLACAFL